MSGEPRAASAEAGHGSSRIGTSLQGEPTRIGQQAKAGGGGCQRGQKVHIAKNPTVPSGLRLAWRRIECISVSGYLQALTSAVAELKWDINRTGEGATTDRELLAAFNCAVADRKKDASYSTAACRLLVAEFQDTDAAFLDLDEAEAW